MPSGTAGRRYAQAFFEIARNQNKVDEWAKDLDSIAQTFDQPEVKRYLENPKTAKDKKRAFVQNVLGTQVSTVSLNLALVLIQRERQEYIDAIRKEFIRLVNQLKGIEIAYVTTAVPVDEAEKRQIKSRLSALTGKQIEIETQVDPDLIGGIVARIGDTQIDGSVKTRLQALRKQLA
ncbi:MAG: ATP synthase F1 subunit delta [Chloroflexota bacterium]|nr:ATP synthase F1 subunit delta [Chloroflexota bacterium]